MLLYIFIALCTTFVKPIINTLALYFDKLLYINTFIDKFNLGFFGAYITYYLTGWYIVHIGISKKWMKNLIYILGGISALLIVCIVQLTKDYENTYSNAGIFVYLYSVSIFLAINSMKLQNADNPPKTVLLLSKLSFGIYIIHPMIDTPIGEVLREYITNPLIQIPLKFTIVFAMSFFASYAISKIPVLKKLIRT